MEGRGEIEDEGAREEEEEEQARRVDNSRTSFYQMCDTMLLCKDMETVFRARTPIFLARRREEVVEEARSWSGSRLVASGPSPDANSLNA